MSERQKIIKWVESWKRADSALKEVRKQELRDYDLRKNAAIIDDMLNWVCIHQKTRLSSGLVEQQSLFMRLRKKAYRPPSHTISQSQHEPII